MKLNLIALFILGFACKTIAQEEKFIVIDRGASKWMYKEKKERRIVDNMSVLKFSPLQMLAGEINFGYERKIDEMSSIEFELGPTLSNVGFSVNNNHFGYIDPFYSYTTETSKPGFFASAGYRFYPLDNSKALNGFYVSPVLKYRLMNFGIVDYSENLKDTKGSENHFYFTFNFGYQTWLSDNFSLDFFGGLGLGYESHIRYRVLSAYDGNTGSYSYFWDKNAYDGVRYLLTLGVKVGIGK